MGDDIEKRPSGQVGPDGYGDQALVGHLVDVQSRTRQIMQEFNIGSANVCVMARRAEQQISDTALRAEFLRLLIDLHEFGREAMRRGVLGKVKGGEGSDQSPQSDAESVEPAEPAARAEKAGQSNASLAFFASLD